MTSEGTARRDQLSAVMDAYVRALVRRHPGDLPVADGLRVTENGQDVRPGRGLWCTATAVPPPQRAVLVADDAGDQVAMFGTVSEHGVPALFGARLRTGPSGITEIETLVCREGHSRFDLFDAAGMAAPRPHFDTVVDPDRRSSREDLVAAVEAYFDGIEHDDGRGIPVRADCVRFENGVQAVRTAQAFGGGFSEGGRMGVADQISSGMFAYIEEIRDRRYPVIDEARGLIVAHVCFDHPGRLTSVDVRGVGTVELPPFARRPNTALIMELFKVEAGEIVAIEALLDLFPYGMRSGWHSPDDDGGPR